MKRVNLVEFNRALVEKMNNTGIRIEDFECCDLYRSYLKLSETMKSRKEVVLALAAQYHLSDARVVGLLRRLVKSVK